MSRPCQACEATGWNNGKAGGGQCKLCDGKGYHDKPPIDTPKKLLDALERLRDAEARREEVSDAPSGG